MLTVDTHAYYVNKMNYIFPESRFNEWLSEVEIDVDFEKRASSTIEAQSERLVLCLEL
jgi:hypothetical protein